MRTAVVETNLNSDRTVYSENYTDDLIGVKMRRPVGAYFVLIEAKSKKWYDCDHETKVTSNRVI